MKFVIVRNSDGAYVAKQGNLHSYTRQLSNARVFDTWEQAAHELCVENEHIIER